MNPTLLSQQSFVFTGIESKTTSTHFVTETQKHNDQSDQLNLIDRIQHVVDYDHYYVVLWNWHREQSFSLLTALAVESASDQPMGTTSRHFSASDYAVIPMQGVTPNLVEPWNEIIDWYPFELQTFTTTLRRYNLKTNTGEILVPLTPALKPET